MNSHKSEYAGRYKHWSKEDIAQLRRMAGKHASVTAIARRFNRSVGAIRTRAYAEGISLAQKEKAPRYRSPSHEAGNEAERPSL